MSQDSSSIVSKVWNYAHVLKNAGVGYGDYVEVRAARALVTCLLFLKLADEMTELGFDNPTKDKISWWVGLTWRLADTQGSRRTPFLGPGAWDPKHSPWSEPGHLRKARFFSFRCQLTGRVTGPQVRAGLQRRTGLASASAPRRSIRITMRSRSALRRSTRSRLTCASSWKA